MPNRYPNRILTAVFAALLSGLMLHNTALADSSDSADTNSQPEHPAWQYPGYPYGYPMLPPPGYYPPYAMPHYPPAWGHASPFDDPWFRRFDQPGWDPYAEIERMQRDMDRFIQNTIHRFGIDRDFARMNGVITPGLDLRDEGDHYVAVLNLPGADKDAINIQLDGQTLSISAEQHQQNKRTDARGNIIFQERRSGMFKRMVTLPEPVSSTGMRSDYQDGVLTITIPKQAAELKG